MGADHLDRYVQSSKMVHAALLLLMLEAVTTNLVSTISLKRSTQNLQLSTSCRPITPSVGLTYKGWHWAPMTRQSLTRSGQMSGSMSRLIQLHQHP